MRNSDMERSTPITCGLLGEHLGHSFSPQIHRELADYPYGLYEVEKEALGDFMRTTTLTAFNVTIPYKKDVMPYLAEISEEARRIGSVNTVTRRADGSLRGDNTDYYGFSKMVEISGIAVKNRKVLLSRSEPYCRISAPQRSFRSRAPANATMKTSTPCTAMRT